MIAYSKTNRGDILRMTKPTPDLLLKRGDLVRVTKVEANGVMTEDAKGQPYEFVFNCGAAYLEPTEWKNDFPDQQQPQSAA